MPFLFPTLVFGARFNPYPVRLPVLGVYKTIVVNRPAYISYTLSRAPQSQRVVIVEPPRGSRFRYFVYDPYVVRFGPYPVVVENDIRYVYLTRDQAYQWLRNEQIGEVAFYSLPWARRKIIYQFSGHRIPPNQPPEVANPVPDQTATIGTPFTFTVPADTFEDPDDPSTSFYWSMTKGDGSALPVQGLNFNPLTRVLSGTPTGSPGVVTLKVSARDPFGRVATDTFTVTLGSS